MKIQYKEADLFAYIKTIKTSLIIAHICNDKGAWGKGFVVPLGKRFPEAKQYYLDSVKRNGFELGLTQFIKTSNPNIIIANMVAQTLGGERPLYYNYLVECMERIAEEISYMKEYEIVAPFFGSNLARGNWNFIEQLIKDCWIKRDIPVTICYLPGQTPKNWKLPI